MGRFVVFVAAICIVGGILTDRATAATPVIIDTDIGTDFDDSAALAVALQRDDLDVKLILTATGDTVGRAKIVAKYLQAVGRTDVAVGVGLQNNNATGTALYGWAADYDLSKYPGPMYMDGITAAVNVIKASPTPVTIMAIAPATNFPSMLSQDPSIVHNAVIKAMSGSIYRGYNNSTQPTAEYNVRVCPYCTRLMYTAGWSVTTTPLDTCGIINLQGASYDAWTGTPNPFATTLAQCYLWWINHGWYDPGTGKVTDTWYDTVAAYLSTDNTALANIKTLNLVVTDDGHTVVDNTNGTPVNVALTWTSLDAYLLWVGDNIAGQQ